MARPLLPQSQHSPSSRRNVRYEFSILDGDASIPSAALTFQAPKSVNQISALRRSGQLTGGDAPHDLARRIQIQTQLEYFIVFLYIDAMHQIALGLARLAALARQDEWRAGEAEGITPTQGDIVIALALRPEGMRVGALAAQLHVSQATASDALAALDRKALIERYADPSDRRATLLRLSRKGRALAKRWPNGYARVIDTLSPKDQATLMGIVVRAIAALERQGAVSRQRMCLSCQFFVENAHPGAARPHHCRLIGAALGEGDLRIDCPEHQEANAA